MSDAGEDSDVTVPLEEHPEGAAKSQQDDNDDAMSETDTLNTTVIMEASDSLLAEVLQHNEEDAAAVNPNPIELRRQQRQLNKDIQLASNGCTATELGKFRDKNNVLWDHLKRMFKLKKINANGTGTREAVLDGNNLDLITDRYVVNAQSLNTVPRYETNRLAEQLAKKGSVRTSTSSPPRFHWNGFGVQVGLCFNAVPDHCSFLYGPLDADYVPKERKKPERRKKQTQEELSDAEEEQPDTIIQQKNNVKDNELSAVGIHIKKVKSMLKKKSKEQKQSISQQEEERYINSISEGGSIDETSIQQKKRKLATELARVNASKVLLDKSSFTKTVENINNFSFLVKHSKAGIKVRSYEEAGEFKQAGIDLPSGPVIYPVPKGDQMSRGTNAQAVLAFSMKDWRKMSQVFGNNDDDFVPIGQRKRPPEVLAREMEDDLVAAGTTSQHESPHPAVVTQTDDVELSGGNDNNRKRKADEYDGGISGDACKELDRNITPRNPNGGHEANGIKPLGKREKQSTPSRSRKRKSRSPSRVRSCLEVLDLTQTTPVKSVKQNKRHIKVKKERNVKKEQKNKRDIEVIDLCDSD